jgi:hypothetical protein
MSEWTVVKRKKNNSQMEGCYSELFNGYNNLNTELTTEYLEKYPFDLSKTNLEYKKVNNHNIPDLELYFKEKLRDFGNFKKVISADAKVNIEAIELLQINNSVKITKDINKCYVVLVFETDNKILPYCVISYKLNMFYLDKNEYCVFLRNWMEVLVYMFKFEIDIKNDTTKSMIAEYPLEFYNNKNKIITFVNQFRKIWR